MSGKRLVVEVETGEIVTTLREGDSILRKESENKLKETEIINKGRVFVKLFIDTRYLINYLTPTSLAISMLLQSFVKYETGEISYDNGKQILNNDIVEMSGISRATVNKCMEELIAKRVFGRFKIGKGYQYYANPYIFCRGNRVNKTLINMFKDYKYR